MNPTKLTRQYDVLTPWERVSLMTAAAGRGDEVETSRLAESAPRVRFRVADYWGLAEGLDNLVKQYLLGQLEFAATYWQVTCVLDQEPPPRQTPKAKQREDRLWRALRALALRFVTQAEGLKLLCRELQIDPEIFLRDMPGYEIVRQMEDTARAIACTREEAIACLRDVVEHEKPTDNQRALLGAERFDTAEDVARSMRTHLEEQLAAWS
jgi:hypothetical protein